MTNKYLEKIALNKIEAFLKTKASTSGLSNPVQKLHSAVNSGPGNLSIIRKSGPMSNSFNPKAKLNPGLENFFGTKPKLPS